jgi:hypothetical protein
MAWGESVGVSLRDLKFANPIRVQNRRASEVLRVDRCRWLSRTTRMRSIAGDTNLSVASRATATTMGSVRSAHRLYWMPLGHSDSQLALASECISRSRTEIAAYVHRVLQKSVTQIGCAHNCVPIATLPRPFRPCLSVRHVLNHRARRRSRDRLGFVK